MNDAGSARVPNRSQRRDPVADALILASRGFAVFPLRPGAKIPAVAKDWESAASTDAARLRALIRNRTANLGIACGPSGLLVVDLDVAKTPDACARDGAEVFAALAGGRWVPPTFTVETPSGGRHLYFRAPTHVRLGNTASRLGPLIDTRAAGGYVVAPGSVIGGRAYRIAHDHPVAALPQWLLAALVPPPATRQDTIIISNRPSRPYVTAAVAGEVSRVLAAREGTRNDTLNRAAFALGQLVGAGLLERAEAQSHLETAGRSSGLADREVRSTVLAGLDAGQDRPRAIRLA